MNTQNLRVIGEKISTMGTAFALSLAIGYLCGNNENHTIAADSSSDEYVRGST